MSQLYKPSPRSFFAMAASSLTGMILAIPIALAIYVPNNNDAQAQGAQNGASTAVAKSDYAMFAYAYSQGMLAAQKTSSQSTPGTCQEQESSDESSTPGMGSVSGNAGLQTSASMMSMPSGFTPGRGNVSSMGHEHEDMDMHHDHGTTVTNAYNTYKSIVENSWNYVNSNNTVGSYNTNTTSVDVNHSTGVTVGVSNDNTSTNVSNNDVNHSWIDTTTAVDNSDTNKTTVNNSTETTNVNSGNTTTMVDSGNTMTNTTTNTNVDSNNTTTNSNNTTNTTTNTDIDNSVTNNEHNNVHNNTHNNEHDNVHDHENTHES